MARDSREDSWDTKLGGKTVGGDYGQFAESGENAERLEGVARNWAAMVEANRLAEYQENQHDHDDAHTR